MKYRFFIILIFISGSNFIVFANSDAEATKSYLILAEHNIDFSFERLLSVDEDVGEMNILVNDLNNLIELLSEAKIQYKNGDLSSSSENAVHIIEKCSEINIRAQNIARTQRTAEIRTKNNIFSRVILLLFIFVILFLWNLFKDYYKIRTTSKMLVENTYET